VFGYAATFDVTDVPYAVVDEDRSPESRDLLARFSGSGHFALAGELDSTAAIREPIDSMHVRLVFHIGPDFAERLHSGRPAQMQVLLDGRNSNVSGIALGYVQSIVAAWSRAHPLPHSESALTVVQRAWFNPALESRWFIVSGLPAQIALVVVMLLASLSVAREREQGTFDQTLVAPISALQILVGKAVPPFVLGLIDGLLLSGVAVAWFSVPMEGTLVALAQMRMEFGAPWTRMAAILGAVAVFTALSALVFWLKAIQRRYAGEPPA